MLLGATLKFPGFHCSANTLLIKDPESRINQFIRMCLEVHMLLLKYFTPPDIHNVSEGTFE